LWGTRSGDRQFPYLEVNTVWVVKMLLTLILVVIVTGFAMLNSAERATVTIWPKTVVFFEVPLVILLFEAFVLGAVVWFIVSVFHEISLRSQIRKLKRENSDLNQEIAGLHSISLQEIEGEAAQEDLSGPGV
jgi:uncharacterized integral membrane protein